MPYATFSVHTVLAARLRITDSFQQFLAETGQPAYTFSYHYTPDNNLRSERYPSGLNVSTCYDYAGRPSWATSEIDLSFGDYTTRCLGGQPPSGAEQFYVRGTEYITDPNGNLQRNELGNSLWEYTHFNERQQMDEVRLGTMQDAWDVWMQAATYNPPGTTLGCSTQNLLGNNGNIWSLSMTLPTATSSVTLNQNFAYDCFNRLTTSSEAVQGGPASWARTNAYDTYGNRAVTGSDVGLFAPTSTSHFSTATNRITTVPGAAAPGYDNGGNLTSHAGIGQLTYDGENRGATFFLNNAGLVSTGSYSYDGDGNRIKRTGAVGVDSTETYYVYDALGRMAAEFSQDEETGFGGVEYRTTDHLSSTRVVTNDSGGVIARRDFFPFGEEIPEGWGDRSLVTGYTTSPVFAQEFTAKERDDESGLDYFLARYYRSSLGRFNSVDPGKAGADPSNPQSWNAYAYVNNNPLIFVDPDGLALTIVTFEGEDLTDEQRKFIEENREQIQQTIADRFKEAGVEDVFFLSASDLTDDQRAALTQRETTGIGLLNFVDTSIANFDASRRPSLKGGTSAQGTSAVFLGNLGGENGLAVGAELAFGVGEVSSHELGHQFGFPATGATAAFIKRMFGGGNLMDEGQGNPRPGSPQFFDASDKVIQRVVREINTRGSSISRRRRR